MAGRLVIIGGGMAAGRLLEALAEAGSGWKVTLINAEPRGTYNRIMLSPVLAGEKTYPEIVTHDDAWYRARGVACHFGARVTGIDRAAQTVTLASGTAIGYDRLVIATGAMPLIPPLPGAGLGGVIAYRDLEDTERMMRLGAGTRAVVIGGGLLGLEAAAGMAARGVAVTVVHRNSHLLDRQLDPAAAGLLQRDLETRGIRVLTAAETAEIRGAAGQARALLLADGTELSCDLVVMAAGIRPNSALAEAAGLNCARGILVDAQMRSSDPAILAIGECIEFQGQTFGLVAPVFDHALIAADTLMGRRADYAIKEVSAKLKVTGCDLFSAGDFEDRPGREEIVLHDPLNRRYRRLVIEDNRILGIVLYGDTADGSWFFNLMREGTDIGALRDTLIFGPACQPEQAA